MRPKENESEFGVGIVLSFIYIACYAVYFLLSENSIFDLGTESFATFLAGFSSPLAFLWLVLGYRQQSQDLKSQAKQLKLAVDEYKDQNSLTETQLNAYWPSFDIGIIWRVYDKEWSYQKPEQVRFKFPLQNSGGDARGVCIGLYKEPVAKQTYTMRVSIPRGFKDPEYIVSGHFPDLDAESHMYITISGWDALDRYFRFDFRTNGDQIRSGDTESNGFPMHRVIVENTIRENISGYYHDLPKVTAVTRT